MTTETKRGGARVGAGRKPSPSPRKRHQIMLTTEDAATLRELGGGNVSKGVALAAAYYRSLLFTT